MTLDFYRGRKTTIQQQQQQFNTFAITFDLSYKSTIIQIKNNISRKKVHIKLCSHTSMKHFYLSHWEFEFLKMTEN